MDRQRGERQGDRAGDGGGRRPRMSSRWSSPGSPPGSHHRYPNHSRGGGDGFSGGGGRHHPYRHPEDYPPPPRGGGSGPGFRGGPGGFGNQMPMGGGSGPRRGGGFSGRGGSSPDYNEGSNFAKLFIGSVPRTATEGEIRPLFEEHGDVLEVAFIKDKRTGQQQGCCFVKYATAEEADRAIRALHNQYTLPGGLGPIQVRYADGERERLVEHKLFVGAMNKQATEKEIEEIFSPYGRVEDVYIMRDDLKQSRGCGFVKFSNREMALAAMNALNGTYVMRGCEQPLIVRFADPKRPRPGDARGGPAFGGPGFGPRSQAPFAVRPTQGIGESFGGRMQPNAWPPISPQSMGPSSQADADGYGRGGVKAASSASHDNLGAAVGATNGSITGIGTNSSQQGFNPSMAQPELTGQQISPAQKPLMSPQNLLPSMQLHQAQQTLASQPQNLRASMNQFVQHQIPQSVGSSSSQGLPSQQLMGLGSQLASSQHLVQTNPAANALQTPLGLQQQGMPGAANQQQLPASQMLQQPIQQLPSQLSQALLQQQAQSLQSSFQSSQQAISRIQQQLQLMQQSSQQQSSQTTKQQIAPQATSGGPAGTSSARMPSTVSSTLPLAGTQPLAPLTCNWSEHTSPEGYKYYYNSVSKESKWEKPEELTVFEQQQQQQQKLLLLQQHQLKVAAQHIQLPSQTQPHTQIQSNQLAQSQVQQAQAQLQLNQQAQLQLLQPSLMYQASGAAGHQNIQDINYSQLQGPNSVIDPARTQQAAQAAQDWMWKNKPAGS